MRISVGIGRHPKRLFHDMSIFFCLFVIKTAPPIETLYCENNLCIVYNLYNDDTDTSIRWFFKRFWHFFCWNCAYIYNTHLINFILVIHHNFWNKIHAKYKGINEMGCWEFGRRVSRCLNLMTIGRHHISNSQVKSREGKCRCLLIAALRSLGVSAGVL